MGFYRFYEHRLYERFIISRISGLRDLFFVTGWICSVVGLYKLQAMGNKRWQKNIMFIQLILLIVLACSCFFKIVFPRASSTIFHYLFLLWPAAGFFMVITGSIILFAKKLKGWRLYVPLIAGFWFPETVMVYYFTKNSLLSLVISGVYSTIIFSLLGLSVFTADYISSARKISY